MKSVRYLCALTCLLFCVNVFGQPSKAWRADLGNGRYQNPILHADYSDPDAIRVGNTYYMVSSSFNCIPGLPILQSDDLVNWRIGAYAIAKLDPIEEYDKPEHGKGVWAPALRYRNGEFLIYYPDPDHGIFMIKARKIVGPWSKPVQVCFIKGLIDPCPFWDNDGRAYLAVAWAGSRGGVNSLLTIYPMNTAGTKVIGEGRHVYDGHGIDHTVEGPKIYKRNGYYYILAPAGGVATGWQIALRSRSIFGPYERKMVLAQGKTNVNGPHQGALLDTPAGESWFLHFQDKGPYGRVIHLQPVGWKADWPIIGADPDGDGVGEPVSNFKKPFTRKPFPVTTPTENDEFNSGVLGLQWQWHANPKIQWWANLPGVDFLRLFCLSRQPDANNLWDSPNLLLQKMPAASFTATTKVRLTTEWEVWEGKKAGIIITGNDYAYLSITRDKQGYKIGQYRCRNAAEGTKEELLADQRISSASAYLRVQVKGPDAKCTFSFSEDGKTFQAIGKEFAAQPERWIGAKVGLFATGDAMTRMGGYADFDWFRVD